MLKLRQAFILLIAELWFCTLKVECDGNFTQCYNTASETHCFSKIVNGPVNFSDAQNRCSAIDATIPTIKDGEVQQLLETFISNLYQSVGIEDSISYFWINAYRVVGTKWQWLNSSVINELSVNVTTGFSLDVHVASIGSQNSGQQDVHLVANNPGEIFSYICEFFGNDCQRQDGSVLQYGGKCYVAYKENGTWYDARNRCLQERGDLASFGDLKNTNINFTQWLDLSNGKQYWVGARIIWWSWKTPDNAEVRYTSWFRHYPVTLYNTDECLTVWASSALSGWKTDNCNKVLNVGAICQKVTSLDSSKSTTTSSSFASSKSATASSLASSQASTVVPLSFEPSKSTTTMASFDSSKSATVSSLASSTAPTVLPISFEPPKSTTTMAPFDSSKSTTAAPFDSSKSATAAAFDSSKSTTAAAVDSSADTTISNNCSSCAAGTVESLESSAGTSRAVRLGVGIGLGLGIPIIIALIVIIVVCVRQKRKPRSSGNNYAVSSHDHVLHDAHATSLETDKNDVETGEIYSEVAKNDDDQVIESNANNIEYSAVEFVDGGEDREDLP